MAAVQSPRRLASVQQQHALHQTPLADLDADEVHPGSRTFAVVMADVDGLKETNDIYGHPMGDRLLMAVAAAMSREDAAIGRYGGDEFVALLREGDVSEASAYIEAVRCALSNASLAAEDCTRVPTVASFGYATYPVDATTVDDLIRVSDHAMYQNKRGGRPESSRTREDRMAA